MTRDSHILDMTSELSSEMKVNSRVDFHFQSFWSKKPDRERFSPRGVANIFARIICLIISHSRRLKMNRDYGAGMHDAYQPLMPTQTGNVFVPNSHRRRRDTAWTLCWATTYTACVVLGLFAFMHRSAK